MITIRASSLAELFDCPARWEAKYLRKLTLPRSGAAQLGTAIHASTAVFDKAALDGNPVTPDEAAGAAVDAIHRPEAEVLWEEFNQNQAEKIALSLNRKYCENIAPLQSYLGIEVTCESLVITDLDIELTGTTDRVRISPEGELGITDMKSGAGAVNAQGEVKIGPHKAQLAVYELLAGQALGQPIQAPAQVIGMQTGKTERAQRVAIGEVDSASLALVGDEYNPGLLEMAAKVAHSGIFSGNPRSQLCGAKYCPAYRVCRFRG